LAIEEFNMKKFGLAIACLFALSTLAFAQDRGAPRKVGDVSPVTSAQLIDGTTMDFKGKIVVLQFWATWCGPCQQTMPYIENNLWKPFKDKGLVVIGCGREHSISQVAAYQKQKGYTFYFNADVQKQIYGTFATASIPRTVVIGKDGKIKFQMVGLNSGQFNEMLKIVSAELAKN
jgi:thiol-disulfide isomerase/thioredoxin